jgi:hypothetical protein
MKKEMIISVLVGLTFGLIIVYGIYTAQNSLSNQESKNNQNILVSPTPDSQEINAGNLKVHSPEDQVVVNEPSIDVVGESLPQAYVVIFINDQESIINADENGHFSITGELELGSNIIQIHTIDEDGQTSIIERTVIYTTKPLIEEGEIDQLATDSANKQDEE